MSNSKALYSNVYKSVLGYLRTKDLVIIYPLMKSVVEEVIESTPRLCEVPTCAKDLFMFRLAPKLIIRRNKNIKDEHLNALDNIQEVIISDCRLITDKGMIFLSTKKNLTTIELELMDKLTNQGLVYLQNIKYMILKSCFKIDTNGIKQLHSIKDLALCRMNSVTHDCIKDLQNLKKLSIANCENVNLDRLFTNIDNHVLTLETLALLYYEHPRLDLYTSRKVENYATEIKKPKIKLELINCTLTDDILQNINTEKYNSLVIQSQTNLNPESVNNVYMKCLLTKTKLKFLNFYKDEAKKYNQAHNII